MSWVCMLWFIMRCWPPGSHVIIPSLLVGQKKSSACFFHHSYQVHDVKFMAREEVLDLGKVLIAAIYGFRTPCIRLPCVTQEDDVNGQNWALEFGGNEFQSNSVSKKLLFFFSWHILSVQECGSTWACTGLSMHGCERASACMSVRKIRKCGRRA